MMKLRFLLAVLAPTLSAALPVLLVILTPIFEPIPQNVTAINITLSISDPQSAFSRPLLQLALNNGATRTLRYDGDALQASDSLGSLPLIYTDTNESNAQRLWRPSRDPVGEVLVRFLADPPPTNESTPSGPRVDLREDQGGLLGMAEGFIPRPPAEEDWEVNIHWNVPADAPTGTKVVCSIGEGAEVSVVGVPSRVLSKSYFAVGQVQRWPPWEQPTYKRAGRDFAMYYFGELPYDIDALAPTVQSVTEGVADFFGDPESPFRVFWRKVWVGYGGTGGYQSFLVEYAPYTEEELSAEGLENLVAHESIHEYALPYPIGRQYDVWYREGIAVYYAVVAPYLSGDVDKAYLIRWLNNNAQAYYTGGTTQYDWQYVLDHYWAGTQMVKTSYFRGFVYLAKVEGLISLATNGTKGLDDLTLELYRRFKVREPAQSEQFVELLGKYIGQEAAQASFEEMKSGNLIIPPTDGLLSKFDLGMIRQDAEKLDLGFTESTFGLKKVTGLVPGSRAEQAGLREGDVVIRFWVYWGAGESLDNKMKLVIKRDGQDIEIVFWPRSYEKVENYKWADAKSSGDFESSIGLL